MADAKISQLTAVTPTTDDIIPVVDLADNTTKKATLASLPISTATATAISAVQADVDANQAVTDAHIANTSNPHSVTKLQVGLGNVDNTSDLNKPISTATQAALDGKEPTIGFTPENVANKDVDGTLSANSDTKYPSQKAVKTYVDNSMASGTPDATSLVKGKLKLAGDLGGTADSPTVPGLAEKATGPASATDNAIARFDGTTGKLIQNSSVTVDDSGNITANNLSGINTGDQFISLTGDVTGSGTGTFAATLSNTGVGAGTYTNANVTVDSKGRVTAVTSGSSGSGWTVSTTNEVPVGAVNGSNTVFTISNSAANNEIVVTINGLKQIETTDYTLSGTTLTFTTAPFTGALLEVYYVHSTSAAGYAVQTKSANYTLVNTDYVILADTTSGNVTLTLPTAVGQSGRQFVLKKTSYNNAMVIATTSSQTIDGDLTQTVGAWSKGAITVHSDGANYHVI